jgi:hypothetical protein
MTWLFTALTLAHVISGEASVCPEEAKLAVAHVYHNRLDAGMVGGWYGYDMPTTEDLRIALTWHERPDPTHGAVYLVSAQDMTRPEVRALLRTKQQTAVFHCARGLRLEAWK